MFVQISTELLFICLLTRVNGFFAAWEIAIVPAHRSRLEALAENENRGAQLVIVRAGDFQVEVVDMDGRRVDKVLIRHSQPEEDA